MYTFKCNLIMLSSKIQSRKNKAENWAYLHLWYIHHRNERLLAWKRIIMRSIHVHFNFIFLSLFRLFFLWTSTVQSLEISRVQSLEISRLCTLYCRSSEVKQTKQAFILHLLAVNALSSRNFKVRTVLNNNKFSV